MKKPAIPPKDPSDAALARSLGPPKPLWDDLVRYIETAHGPIIHKWMPARTSSLGMLRLLRKQRTILYLIPQENYFLTAFVFGERATAAIRQSSVPSEVIALLNAARVYAEGRGIRLKTRTPNDVTTMQTLAAIKLAH